MAGGIDIDFENVGGPIMDAVFSRLNRNGRMAVCGLISAYNDQRPVAGLKDFGRILMQRLTVRGFIIINYLAGAGEAFADLGRWVADGQIKWKEDEVQGLEKAPESLQLLFNGQHDGKLIIGISDAP